MLFHNLGYKLLSILLAVIVWAIIQGEQVQEVSAEVRVTIHVANGYGVRGDLQRIKAATIRGPQAWLLEVPKNLEADVYLAAGRIGRYRIRLNKDDVKNFNERLELVIHEPYLDLFVDRLLERTIPVKESLQGAPADGFAIEKVSIEPSFTTVKGIRTDLLKLRYVFTEPIDVSGLSENRSIAVKLASPGVGADALAMDTVQVSLQIGDSRVNKRYSMIPLEIDDDQQIVTIKPQLISIIVQGLPGVLSTLKSSDFKASVAVRGLGPGRHELPIKVILPSETNLIETFPEKAVVTIEKQR
jgi:hypothetical protein